MGQQHDCLTPDLAAFIAAQQLFFVATAPAEGRINLSPKGLDSLRVLDERTVAWLDHTGSGNETAAHLRQNGRLTMMFCGFGERALILRLYGRGRAVQPGTAAWQELRPRLPAMAGERQIFVLDVESCSTSCGSGVPRYEFVGDRPELPAWAERVGPEGLATYRQRHNAASIDGLPTGLPDPEA